jgi:hypothetical protein
MVAASAWGAAATVPAAVNIAICQNRCREMVAIAVSALKTRFPLKRIFLKSGYATASDNYLLSQRQNAFTSVGLLISAIFAPIVAKKPHIPLNRAGRTGGRDYCIAAPWRPVKPVCGLPARHSGTT